MKPPPTAQWCSTSPARCWTTPTAADAADAALVKANAEADALKAHAKGGEAGNALRADADNAEFSKITQAQFDAMAPKAQAAFFKAGGQVV